MAYRAGKNGPTKFKRPHVLPGCWITCIAVALFVLPHHSFCQLVNTGGGPGTIEPQIAFIDFSQLSMEQDAKRQRQTEQERQRRKQLVDSGAVSALDLAAPPKAVHEFNEAVGLMRTQHPQEAVEHWRKAIALYPKFVSAHNGLGLAYLDMDDRAQAKDEFETAAKLDEKYSSSVLNLGRLALSQGDYSTAEADFMKIASVRPVDPVVLTALAYSQNGTRQYREAIATAVRVHDLQHKGMGNVHYIAAAAGLALNDRDVVERELKLFLIEDPTNPLAPVAHQNLDVLARTNSLHSSAAVSQPAPATTQAVQTFPDSERLKSQLRALNSEPGGGCDHCAGEAEAAETEARAESAANLDIPMAPPESPNAWTIRKVVDEVALFFAVSSHGHTVNDLELSDLEIRDDAKPPAKILQFAPQSKLPLRVALLIDTSGSVQSRFSFEKYAATRFLQQLLTNEADMAFVAGFANAPTVTQDFTGQREQLAKGVEQLSNAGGTALFDAVSFSCWKLAAYPERERVAKVLVIVSDGEDNSSRTTLRQAVRDAEAAGVTIYAVSTKEGGGLKTAADRVLEELTSRSGGEALFPGDTITLRKSFDKLRDLIRSRYLVAYKPADLEADGKYRRIEIIVEKDGKRLQVHARKGYRAPYEPSSN